MEKNSFLTYRAQDGFVSLSFLLLLFVFSCPATPKVAAQPSDPRRSEEQFQYPNFNPSMALIIGILLAALFFMVFFSIYIRHCTEASSGNSVRRALSLRRRAAARGLEASVIETFPTFTFAEVKDHHFGKEALECAVCLNEFEDSETLRLIPKCDHVFHPECIDAWLESHVTCPVCRANLTPQPDDPPVQVPDVSQQEQQGTENQQQNDAVSIHIVNDEDQRQQQLDQGFRSGWPPRSQDDGSVDSGVKRSSSFNIQNWQPRSLSIKRPRMLNKFRSHSTGHSLVIPGENLDRYTLRLPEEIRKEVMNRAVLNTTKSSRRGYRTGEGSSKGGRSYRRIERNDQGTKSDRLVFTIAPPFFSRGPSVKSPRIGANNNGEGSTSRGVKTTVKMPSFKCLEPKGDETYLVSADSARPPV